MKRRVEELEMNQIRILGLMLALTGFMVKLMEPEEEKKAVAMAVVGLIISETVNVIKLGRIILQMKEERC